MPNDVRIVEVERTWADYYLDSDFHMSATMYVFVGGQWRYLLNIYFSPEMKYAQVYFGDGFVLNERADTVSSWRVREFRTGPVVTVQESNQQRYLARKAAKRDRDREIRARMQSPKGQSTNNYARKGNGKNGKGK